MFDPLTIVTWAFSAGTAFANSEQGKEFIKAGIGEVAKKLTTDGMTKIDQLRNFIAEKLKGNPAAKEALDRAEAGSVDDLKDVANYLDMVARKDEGFAQELSQRVQEIQTLVQFDDVNAETSLQFFAPVEQVVNQPTAPVFYVKDNAKVELKYEQPRD